MSFDYQRYGIAPGQIYARADGGPGRLVVRDVATLAEVGDVIVVDEDGSNEQRIDAFKLAMVRYKLLPPPYATRSYGYGGSTGINDYLMTDGSIKAMRPDEVVWAPKVTA